jgi:hypothetical protein
MFCILGPDGTKCLSVLALTLAVPYDTHLTQAEDTVDDATLAPRPTAFEHGTRSTALHGADRRTALTAVQTVTVC